MAGAAGSVLTAFTPTLVLLASQDVSEIPWQVELDLS